MGCTSAARELVWFVANTFFIEAMFVLFQLSVEILQEILSHSVEVSALVYVTSAVRGCPVREETSWLHKDVVKVSHMLFNYTGRETL